MTDAELIDSLGGPAKVCELLRLDKARGVPRVHNWKARGIPPKVRLERPDLFLPGWQPAPGEAEVSTTPPAEAAHAG